MAISSRQTCWVFDRPVGWFSFKDAGRRYIIEFPHSAQTGYLEWRSKKAVETNILIVDAFIALKEFALNYVELSTKLKEIETTYSQQFKDVYDAINYLLQKDQLTTKQVSRKRIGFKEN